MAEDSDVLVVGHTTLDIERIGSAAAIERAGGVALYAGVAAARLGALTTVLTRAPGLQAVRALQDAAAAGAEIVVRPSPRCHTFVHEYPQGAAGPRRLSVTGIATPFAAADLRTIQARAIVLGPLTASDLEPELFSEARARAELVALGAQGLVRRIDACSGAVTLGRPADMRWLEQIDVLACDADEARALTDLDDPRAAASALHERSSADVVVTCAAAGAWVASRGHEAAHVPAITPGAVISATGAGDTFLAAYVVARLESRAPLDAAVFAAAAASLQIEHEGPLRANRLQTLARAGLRS